MNHNLKLKLSEKLFYKEKKKQKTSHTVEGRAGNQGMKRRNADYQK